MGDHRPGHPLLAVRRAVIAPGAAQRLDRGFPQNPVILVSFARLNSASHQAKNRVTAAPYAARVCGLRIWAVKNSTIRSAACGPPAAQDRCLAFAMHQHVLWVYEAGRKIRPRGVDAVAAQKDFNSAPELGDKAEEAYNRLENAATPVLAKLRSGGPEADG